MRTVTLINHVLKNHEDKRVYIYIGGKTYELGKAFVTDDKTDDSGAVIEYGRVILCAGEPIMDKTT